MDLKPFRNNIGVVVAHSMHVPGGCLVLNWSDDISMKLWAMGINPELSRFQVEFIESPAPLQDGYFVLAVIKILNREKAIMGGVGELLDNFARSERRRRGIDLDNEESLFKKDEIGFVIAKKNDFIMMASTWVERPKVG